jgi:hypothetical protein
LIEKEINLQQSIARGKKCTFKKSYSIETKQEKSTIPNKI